MNSSNFDLMKHIDSTEIDELNYDKKILNDLLQYNLNQDNIYDILEFAEYYQYTKMDELITKIQLNILEGKYILDKKLIKYRLYELIFTCDCIIDHKCKCDFYEKDNELQLKHVICFKYLTEIENKKYYEIEHMDQNGRWYTQYLITELCYNDNNIELIKYLIKMGYKFSSRTLGKAAICNSLEIIKYLINNKNCENYYKGDDDYEGDWRSVSWSVQSESMDVLKYLIDIKYTDYLHALAYAGKYGKINVVKYLVEEIDYRDDRALEYAIGNKHAEDEKHEYAKVIEYLTNIKH